jgi:hypothetical protein
VFPSLAFLIATPLLGWLCDYNLMRASSEPWCAHECETIAWVCINCLLKIPV